MHKTLRLLTTVAILITLADHPMYGTQGTGAKDYFIVELGYEERGESDRDDKKYPVTISNHIVQKSIPNDVLLQWIKGRKYHLRILHAPSKKAKGYAYWEYFNTRQNNNEPYEKYEADFIQDKKDFCLASEEEIKGFVATTQDPTYFLTYHKGKITLKKLNDTDLTKPFSTWQKPPTQGGRPQDTNPQGDHTLLYILGVVVVCGITYVVLGAKEDTPTSTSEHREKAEHTAK